LHNQEQQILTGLATLTQQLQRLGELELMVCSGARNLVLSVALTQVAEQKGYQVWSHYDERSAGFFMLGRLQASYASESNKVAVIVATSGTAIAELLPAVIEAHAQQRPLIILSADLPRSYDASGAPQCMPQLELFDGFIEGKIDIDLTLDESPQEWIHQLESQWSSHDVWQLNVRFPETKVKVIEALQAPAWRESLNLDLEVIAPKRQPFQVADLMRFLEEDTWRGLVVMLGGLEIEDRAEVLAFLKQLKAPVIADVTSGLRGALGQLEILGGESILQQNKPGKILRIGEVPSGRFWRDLEELPKVKVFSITRQHEPGLARENQWIQSSSITRVLKGLGDVKALEDVLDLLPQDRKRQGKLQELLSAYPQSEVAWMREISIFSSLGNSWYIGNSLPIRNAALAAQSDVCYEEVRANRGVNGIDGQVATFLGLASSCEASWGVLGDVTTSYDVGAFALAKKLPQDAVAYLVVMNNSGGRIFEQLPFFKVLNPQVQEMILQNPEIDLSALAQLWKLHYTLVNTAEDLENLVESQKTGLHIIEIRPDESQSKALSQRLKQL